MSLDRPNYKDLQLPRRIKFPIGRKGRERIVVMDLSAYKVLFQGFDTLHFLYEGRIRYEWWEYSKLREKKLAAQEAVRAGGNMEGSLAPSARPFVEVNGQLWEVSPIGSREYAFCLLRNGWRMFLASNRGMRHRFQMKIEVPSSRLRMGIGDLEFELAHVSAPLVRDRQEWVQRVDMTVDIEGFRVSSFDGLAFHGFPKKGKFINSDLTNTQFVSLGNGQGAETLMIGKNPQLRIYDKLKKSLRDDPDWFESWYGKPLEAVLAEAGGDKRKLKPITRFEFQLRGQVLRELKIDWLCNLTRQAQGLWDYLTCKWVVCKKKVPEIKTKRNLPLAGIWIFLQNVRFGEDSFVVRRKPFSWDSKRNFDQIAGNLSSLMAKENIRIDAGDDEDYRRQVQKIFADRVLGNKFWTRTKFEEKFLKKKVRYQDCLTVDDKMGNDL